MEFTIKYHGHSGFSICVDDYFFMFDYFKGHLPYEDVQNAKNALVFVSHRHKDHFNKKIFSLQNYNKNITYIMDKGIKTEKNVAFMLPNQKLRIKDVLVQTFESTDTGLSFLIEYKGVTIFHAGDLNLWSWRENSTQQEIDLASKNYYKILNAIMRTVQKIDIAFFPVDPRMNDFYEEGAVKFLEVFDIIHFFPMHMWGKYKAANILEKHPNKSTIIYKVNNKNKKFKIYIGD